MAFIKDSERKALIKKTEQKYGARKFLITLELFLLLGFIAVTIVSAIKTAQGDENWSWFLVEDGVIKNLTMVGWIMLVVAAIVLGLGIASLILTWTLKSPSQIKANINKLNSSALSGKRIKGKKAVEVTKSRTTIQKKK